MSNVKNNWLAFGALVEMPQSVKVLKSYCLDDRNTIGYRIATLHALKYLDKNAFDGCWTVLKSSQSYSKILLYLDYLKNKRAQYVGIHDFN